MESGFVNCSLLCCIIGYYVTSSIRFTARKVVQVFGVAAWVGHWTLRLSRSVNRDEQGKFPMSDTSGVVSPRSQDLGLNNHSSGLQIRAGGH